MSFYDPFILVAGLGLLVIAGDYLVRGAVGFAELLGVAPLIIGLTVVAFGTSAPELLVSLDAAYTGLPGIAIGNVVGSNIANVLLVIGLPALISTIVPKDVGVRRNMSVMLLVSLVFIWLSLDGALSRLDGVGLIMVLAAYIAWQIHTARRWQAKSANYDEEIGEAPHERTRIALYLAGGLIGLPIGAHFTVDAASRIAESFGVSETVVGLTIVALGTSLPELATSVMAAVRGSSAVAIGNVVGSNFFNIAAIMGITATLIPINVDERIGAIDLWVMLAASVALAIFAFARVPIGKFSGGLLVLAYVAYLYSMI